MFVNSGNKNAKKHPKKLTRRQQHSGTKQSHLLVGQLQTAESFSQVKHSADQVVTTCRNAKSQ